jgi:hypothetical protein
MELLIAILSALIILVAGSQIQYAFSNMIEQSADVVQL